MPLIELFVDNFAGGGGASTGVEMAIGRSVDIAINHDPAAIAMHKANHPTTHHYCESVWDVNPRKACGGRPVALAWFSPDCKHFSKAKGAKPVDKHIRGLAWVTIRWAATVRPRVIILENVEEFQTWGPLIPQTDKVTGRIIKKVPLTNDDREGFELAVSEPGELVPRELRSMIPDPKRKGQTFRKFIKALEKHGYNVEWRELRACDYGAPTTRKRFFLVARCDGKAIVWPEPTHGDPRSLLVHAGLLKPWRTAAEIINWELPCQSIFERSRPLAENTLRRIARGLKKFVFENPEPFIVRIGQTGFAGDGRQYPIDMPLTTITSKAEHCLVTPTLLVNEYNNVGGSPAAPLKTILTGNHHYLIAPTLIQAGYGERPGQAPRSLNIEKPLGTVTAGGNKFALANAFLEKYSGQPGKCITNKKPESECFIDAEALMSSHIIKLKGTNIGHPVTEPLQTLTAGGLHYGEVRAFLLKYYGTGEGQIMNDPLGTVTTRDRFGLVTVHGVEYQIVDIRMRMLEPRELFNAQGFPCDYIIDHDDAGNPMSKSEQTAKCGNSVSPVIPEALVRANLPEHCGVKAA